MDFKSRVPGSLKAVARPVVWRLSDAIGSDPRRPVAAASAVEPGARATSDRWAGSSSGTSRASGSCFPTNGCSTSAADPGRMAIPLTGYLSPRRELRGSRHLVRGSRLVHEAQITPRFGNFRFASLGDESRSGSARFPVRRRGSSTSRSSARSRSLDEDYISHVRARGRSACCARTASTSERASCRTTPRIASSVRATTVQSHPSSSRKTSSKPPRLLRD